jgi:excisionase family DNA binding protein
MPCLRYLSVRQTAQEANCTLKYVFDLLYAGKLEGASKVGGRWRIPSNTVEKWCKRRAKRHVVS